MASASALFLALVGVFGQLTTRDLSVLPALFFRFLAAELVILAILRGKAWQTLVKIGRLEWLRVGSVLISQFCLLLTLCSAAALPSSWAQTVAAFERLGEWKILAVIAGLGVFGVLNQSTKSVAYRNVRNPANLGPFLYLSLIVAAIFDWILYGVTPTAETLLGGLLILCSALTILWGTLSRPKAPA
jgi:uncharacterized membrane protein